ncbi:MAG: hypothetical protein ABDH49_01455 [Candidatus Hydrothermales bacterium]
MKKIITPLPFLIYYCIAPLNYDKVAINKGVNYYLGVEGFYAKGKYTVPACNGSPYMDFQGYGAIGTGGVYYGFSKRVAIGVEVSGGAILPTVEECNITFFPLGYAFLKFSHSFSDNILALKIGACYPNYFKAGFLSSLPNSEKFCFSYFWAFPYLHSFDINILIAKNFVLATGLSCFGAGKMFLATFKLGLSFRK